MKQINLYQCEICGKKYSAESTAVSCEKSHMEPVKITCCQFGSGQQYPFAITVSFADGKEHTYY